MPAKDRYHDNIVRALEKDGWHIEQQQAILIIEDRRIYIDLRATRGSTEAIFVEIKVFGDVVSPIRYFENIIGQYVFYRAILDYLGITIPLYLAVPVDAYEDFLARKIMVHVLQYIEANTLLFDPLYEEIVGWKSYTRL